MKNAFITTTGDVRASRAFRDLGNKTLKQVTYGALDDVARQATVNLSARFEKEIEGGPAAFTKIRQGQTRSSVYERKARMINGEVISSIGIRRIQSTYLKYLLGEAEVRRPGDTGVAKSYNFIPQVAARSSGGFSLSTDAQGNLAKNALRKLTKAARPQGAKDAATLGKKLGRAATADELADVRRKRLAKKRKAAEAAKKVDTSTGRGIRDEKGRFITKDAWAKLSQAQRERLSAGAGARKAASGKTAIFFGKVGKGGSMGFFERRGDTKPRLLVLGVKRSVYKKPYLRKAWDESMYQAADQIGVYMLARLRRAIDDGAT